MQIYLPIAEMSVNVVHILLMGGFGGLLSGMFGVGGGFIVTPLLIFMGVPPSVSVATSANQIVAASVSGFLFHWRKQNVDVKMGNTLLIGGLVGSGLGVLLFRWLQTVGQIDLVISLSYVLFLGTIGSLMAAESIRSIFTRRASSSQQNESTETNTAASVMWYSKLPWQVEFPKSKLTISILVPLAIGFVGGIVVSLMGIGGGFVMIPAMIYILHMPTSVVIGTSLYQIIFITANVTFLHAVTTQTVDILLALLLLVGAVIGAQYGSRIGSKLPAEHTRGLLALMILIVAARLAYGLFVTPENLYEVSIAQ